MFPPVDPTRRRFLSVAAGGATALTLAPARAAAPAADPIYAAIERHRALTVPFDAAWDARGRFNDCGECDEKPSDELRRLNDAIDAAGHPMEEAACDLFNTVPTTPAGIATATTADTWRMGYGCMKMRMIPETAATGWNAFWTRSSNPSMRSARRWSDGHGQQHREIPL